MSPGDKSISIRANSDRLLVAGHPRGWVVGGIPFGSGTDLRREEMLHLLCAAQIRRLTNWNHAHVYDPFWRVYHNSKPGNRVRWENRFISLQPDSFVLLPANLVFRTFSGPTKPDHLFLHFTVDPGMMVDSSHPFVVPVTRVSAGLAGEVSASLADPKSDHGQTLQLCLALLHLLFASVGKMSRRTTPLREEIAHALAALEADPLAATDLPGMARLAGMSPRNFQRQFQLALGRTPSMHLREIRLREAARRLAKTNLSIDQIASDLRFANRFHFSRLFQKFMGTAVAKWRRGLQP